MLQTGQASLSTPAKDRKSHSLPARGRTQESVIDYERGVAHLLMRSWEVLMEEGQDEFNMSMRKFLKKVGVTSQQELERVVREK